tara:strand:+ start:285 stop:659 length:375 start_codon:yes stop_codon:yes gene_type:complete
MRTSSRFGVALSVIFMHHPPHTVYEVDYWAPGYRFKLKANALPLDLPQDLISSRIRAGELRKYITLIGDSFEDPIGVKLRILDDELLLHVTTEDHKGVHTRHVWDDKDEIFYIRGMEVKPDEVD